MQRILVAVDGSITSRRALEWAADVACRARLELVAVTVLGTNEDGVGTPVDPALEASRQLQAWCAALPVGCSRPEALVERGDPASVLLEESGQRNVDIVVAGSRGMGEVPAIHLGSVVRRLADRASIPLAVVGPKGMVPTTRLIVEYDLETEDGAVLAFTAELARRMAVPVTAVYASPAGGGTGKHELADEWTRKTLAEVREWSAPMENAGVKVDVYLDPDQEADRIAALGHTLSKHPGATAVVESPDGRGAGRTPLGLVRHSDDAVIVLPTRR